MKQVVQIYRTGELRVEEVPAPLARAQGILVRTACSLISAGTEKSGLALARRSLAGKAMSRPDLVRKVIDKARTEGVAEAWRQSTARLDTPVALGYSSAGVVIEAGNRTRGFRPGDRVACFGAGYASHAEIVFVPANLAAAVPAELDLEDAAFAGVGAIALHGSRVLGCALGETVAVIGLGMLGILSAQILAAAGGRVIAFEPDPARAALSRELGIARAFSDENDFREAVLALTGGRGANAAVVWAASGNNRPLVLAADSCRRQAAVSVPGLVSLEIPRDIFYEKELRLLVPRSAGPGIYDPDYEERGRDYPAGYVRWTAGRNLEEFLRLGAEGRIRIKPLISHRFPIAEAEKAYALISGKQAEPYLGVVLTCPGTEAPARRVDLKTSLPGRGKTSCLGVGLLGAGLFSRGTLLPALRGIKGIALRGVATASGAGGARAGEKFGFDYCTTDYREILSDPAVDCVLIATRHNLHAAMTVEALQAGKAVFVEKPLCLDETELAAIREALAAAGRPLMVGYNRRFSPHSVKIKQWLSGRRGPWVLTVRVNAGFVPAQSWVHDPEEGAGRIIGEVGHFIDLIHFLAGGLTERVYARAGGFAGGEFFNEDNLVITLSLDNGSVASIAYAAGGSRSFPRERVEIFGSGCAGAIENFRSSTLEGTGKTKKYSRPTADRGHRDEFETFFRAVRDGASPVAWEDYHATTLATFRIEESLRRGAEVKL